MSPVLPNFLIAGAAKCGSYSLFYYLGKHPDILTSKVKEISYFTEYWGTKDLQWYKSFFNHWAGEKAIGEATVEYMVDENAPSRIYQTIPHIKLIFIMRDPVQRAWSHYWHRVKMGEEKRDFEAIINNKTSIEYPIKYGLYATQIERYLSFFSKNQMKFVILDELKDNFPKTMRELFKFLEVDETFEVSYEGKINAAKIYRIKLLNYLAATIRSSYLLKRLIPNKILPYAQGIFRLLDGLNKKPFVLPPLPDHHRRVLTEIYSEEIRRLEHIIEKDLSIWRRV